MVPIELEWDGGSCGGGIVNEEVRVLYVDQDGLGHAMVRTLENDYIHPISAENGVDALKRLDYEPIDIVLVPESLSQIGLRWFIDRVRSLQPDVSIVVSGSPDDLPPDVYHVSPDASGRQLLGRLEEIIAERALDSALEGQDRLEGVTFEIAHAVITAENTESMFDACYDGVASSEQFQFVWVWRYDHETGELHGARPLAGRFTPSEITETLDIGDPNFISEAVESNDVTVAMGAERTRSTASIQSEPAAIGGGQQSTIAYAAVPFVAEGQTHGLAILGSSRADAFDTTEQTLLAKLGMIVGKSITTAQSGRPASQSTPARIEQFVEVFTHELRNPLQIAESYLEIGRKERDDEALERVATAHETIERILNTFVQMAGAGEIDEIDEVDVTDAAGDVWRRVRRGSAELTVGKPVTVKADPDLLDRLLSNAFKNAIDHAGEDVSVRIGALSDDLGFFIEDDGPGIAEADRETVLEWGYSTGDGHLGIGLGFVKEIAEAHGWSITVTESALGGARFEFQTSPPDATTDGGTSFSNAVAGQ